MPKEEWGTKRVCPTTGKRFYDMNRSPIVSPYSGEIVTLDTGKSRSLVAAKAKPETAKEDEEDLVLDDDDNADEVSINDDLLEDEEDNVSLEEIADVPNDSDES